MIRYPAQDPSRTDAAYQIISPIQTADRRRSFTTGEGPAKDRRRTGAGPAQGTKLFPRHKQADRRRTGAAAGAGPKQDPSSGAQAGKQPPGAPVSSSKGLLFTSTRTL